MNGGWGISHEIALRWMPLDLTDDKPTLVQVIAWCHLATSHYLSQCWHRSLSPNGITRPQWVNSLCWTSWFFLTIIKFTGTLVHIQIWHRINANAGILFSISWNFHTEPGQDKHEKNSMLFWVMANKCYKLILMTTNPSNTGTIPPLSLRKLNVVLVSTF